VLKYSIVVPLHNEQENVTDLYARLKSVMEASGETFEMVLVDDGSIDGTFALLREIAAVDSRVTVVKLRRNFGQTAGLAAGFDHARGEYIIAMDGDLQHDPADIPVFLEKIAEGYDIVSGWRKNRVDNFWLRRFPSRCANWLMAKLSGVDIHDFGTTFKAYRREHSGTGSALWRTAPLHSGAGFVARRVDHRSSDQECGNRNAALRIMESRALSAFSSTSSPSASCSSIFPALHFFGTLGMFSIMAGSGISGWLIFDKLMYHTDVMAQHGPLMIFSAVLLLAGLNMLAVGLLGEMQVRHYHEPAQRAPYSVDRVLRAQSEESTISE
jgi:glycosyltransferase involved in cell wall biosynthesis